MSEENQVSEEVSEEAAQAVENATENETEEASDQTEAGQESGESQAENETEDTDSEESKPFPKKAKNAISRRDKQIAKLQARIRQMEMGAQQAQQKAVTPEAPQQTGAPREEDFDNYADFLKADVLYTLQQSQSEKQQAETQTQAEQQQTEQYKQYVVQKADEIEAKAAEYAKVIPDFQEVTDESSEILSYAPPEIARIFLEAPDAAMAVYNLSKEGRLVDVMQMTPAQAAMEIGRAQSAPATQPATQQRTPPPPIKGAKGTGKTQKGLMDLEGDALLNKLESLSSN